jgi:hypothetical protein
MSFRDGIQAIPSLANINAYIISLHAPSVALIGTAFGGIPKFLHGSEQTAVSNRSQNQAPGFVPGAGDSSRIYV